MNEKENLLLKRSLTTKFAVFFLFLFIFFWVIYFQKVSKYFILICAWLFLAIDLYYFVFLFLINKKIKQIKEDEEVIKKY